MSDQKHISFDTFRTGLRLSLSLGLFGLLVLIGLFQVVGLANAIPENPPALVTQESRYQAETTNQTESAYLPVVTKGSDSRSLGQVSVNSGPAPCPTTSEQCYNVTVTCPGVADPITADLKIGGPSDSSKVGTILFASGVRGDYYWDFTATAQADLNDFPEPIDTELLRTLATNNRMIIQNLWTDGYQTVQVKWETKGWYTSKPGVEEGQARLACRPATVAKWVYAQIHQSLPDKPYCFAGHSNGSTQASLSLAQYGLADILSGVVLESGPNWSRVDYACLNDGTHLNLYGDWTEIDRAFGGGTGPCQLHDETHRPAFEEASLLVGSWDYHYPNSMVYFLFGGADASKTANHGKLFSDHLAATNTPYRNTVVVPGAGHFVTDNPAGMAAMESALRTSCVLH